MNPDHYQVLGLPADASITEVKTAFRSAALRLHPDKATPDSASQEEFLRVQQAWRVLGDPQLRQAYDRQLQAAAAQTQVQVNERLTACQLETCHVEGEAECLSWPCRCGGAYIVLLDDTVGYGEVLVPCSTCSLYVAVLGNQHGP